MHPLQHIIYDTLEQRAQFPVPARDVYMVMGKLEDQWKTIITKTDDVNHARRTMYSAQIHGNFGRIVLCRAREIQGIDSLRWTTLECALPIRAYVMPPSMDMQKILEKMKKNPANKNAFSSFGRRPETSPQTQAVPVVKDREIANLPLSTAVIGAAVVMQIMPFIAALGLILFDWLYVEEKLDNLLDPYALNFFIKYRPLLYFIVALSVLIPALVVTLTTMPIL